MEAGQGGRDVRADVGRAHRGTAVPSTLSAQARDPCRRLPRSSCHSARIARGLRTRLAVAISSNSPFDSFIHLHRKRENPLLRGARRQRPRIIDRADQQRFVDRLTIFSAGRTPWGGMSFRQGWEDEAVIIWQAGRGDSGQPHARAWRTGAARPLSVTAEFAGEKLRRADRGDERCREQSRNEPVRRQRGSASPLDLQEPIAESDVVDE